jgi:hypothetical protein
VWHFESHDKSRNASLGSNLIASWKTGSIYFVVGIVQHGPNLPKLNHSSVITGFFASLAKDDGD